MHGMAGREKKKRETCLSWRPAEAGAFTVYLFLNLLKKEAPDAQAENRMKLKTADACFIFFFSSISEIVANGFSVPRHIVRILMDANCFGNWRGNG